MEMIVGILIALVCVQFIALALLVNWLCLLGERQRNAGGRFARLKACVKEYGEAHNRLNDHVNKVAVASDAITVCHNNLAVGHQQLAEAHKAFVEGIRTGKVRVAIRDPDEDADWRGGKN